MSKEITFEGKATEFVTKHAMSVAAGLGLCVLIGAIYIGYGMYQSSRETKSQEELFVIQKSVEDKEQKLAKENEPPPVEKDAAKKNKKAKAAPEAPKFEKTPASLAANFAAEMGRYDAFIGAHRGQKASFMAAIQEARLAKDYSNYGQAEKILAGVVDVPRSSDIFSGLLRAQYAAVLMDENKCPEAVKELNQIVDNKAQSFFHAHTWLRLGACYITTKEWDKAQAALDRVGDFANTQAANEAKELKRLATLRSKGE